MTLYDRYRRFAINHPWQSMALWGVLLFLLTFSISRGFGDSFAESLATALLYGFGVFLFRGFIRWSTLYRTQGEGAARRLSTTKRRRWLASNGLSFTGSSRLRFFSQRSSSRFVREEHRRSPHLHPS